MQKDLRILVVTTGGTIACKRDALSGITDIEAPLFVIEEFCKKRKAEVEEAYGVTVSFDTVSPYEILSENLSGDEIGLLFECIDEKVFLNENDYAGVIVTTGSDTYAYVCAALRLFFSDYDKTMVCICANFPPDDERSNALLHFSAACEMIVKNSLNGERGILAVYENGLGDSATFYDAGTILFQQNFSDVVVGCDRGADVTAGGPLDHPTVTSIHERFRRAHRPLRDVKVALIKPYPGLIYPDPSQYEAIVFDTYHSGTLPTDEKSGFAEFIKDAKEKGVAVIISGVSSDANVYASEKIYEDEGVNVIYDVPPAMVYMQTWIIFSLT